MQKMKKNILKLEQARDCKTLTGYSSIVLWGAGSYVEKVMKCLGKEKIVAIYDNDLKKIGKRICGITVSSPEEFKLSEDMAVVISVSKYINVIAKDLCENYHVSSKQIYPIVTDLFKEHIYLPAAIHDHKNEIEMVESLLEDTQSRQYFASYINAVLTMNPVELIENPLIRGVYIYESSKEKIIPNCGSTIVDCGAFIGDTMEHLIHLAKNDCKIYALEPVFGNYQKCCKEAEKYPDISPIVWQYAIGKKQGTVNIISEEEITPRANIHGIYSEEEKAVTTTVKIETLDNLFSDIQVDYIKMDIEGEEMNALIGGQTVIKRDLPTMMLSAYHSIEHLWKIPLLVRELNPSYRIYCGHQPSTPLEPEFYCIAR